ncbi:MAG: deoxyribonuclease IV [Verrucomicrobia bacterium]|nr:deoxyribonuclease IV [Verrucomicrobiota bacterium]
MVEQELLLGAHTSAAGGVFNALYQGREIGATTIQLFTANQRQWHTQTLPLDVIHKWKEALRETGIKSVMSHDSYLINLGAPDPEVLHKSRHAFREEILRCLQLELTFMNFHPGSALKDGVENCLNKIVESLLCVKDLFTGKEPLRLLIETTAGQGSQVGANFDEIGYLVRGVKDELPIGVCIDTCHIFAAGYDIRTKETLDATLEEFDKKVGLQHLYAFHLNDSQKGLGSRVDRHSSLGEGMIGFDCFRAIMQEPRLRSLPKYLETPLGPEAWRDEIKLLRGFAK